MKVLITGASGLLGREVASDFEKAGWEVLGLAFSRSGPRLQKVDLRDSSALKKVISEFQPSIVIHAAAERRADVVEQHPEEVQKLNVDATAEIARICAKTSVPVIFISTNYVFDGSHPPYKPQDAPHPLNKYGESKRQGELVTLAENPDGIILRLPLLYGKVEKLTESSATYILNSVLNTGLTLPVCDFQQRFPTHVRDVSSVLLQMATKIIQGTKIRGIFHWCSSEQLTRYAMSVIIANAFELPHDHLVPQKERGSGTSRPANAQLDVQETLTLGLTVNQTPFADGIKESLAPFVDGKN